MRKNHENTNGIVTSNHYQLKASNEKADKRDSKIDKIYELVKKQSFQADMDAPDIGKFFPVRNQNQLEQFMDRSHPEWDERRKEFYNLLFTCLTDQKNTFSKGLINTIFTREYISLVKWPAAG